MKKYFNYISKITIQDYIIEGVISRLRDEFTSYFENNYEICKKDKRRVSFGDIQPLYEQNIQWILNLESFNFEYKGLTVYKFQS